jgi:soluble lytic murein transglycosylase
VIKNKGKYYKISVIFIICALLLVLFSVLSVITHIERKINEISYPLTYGEYVSRYSLEFDVPQEVIYSIIYCESSFQPEVVSSVGAVGLMQLLPSTFSDLQKRLGESYSDNALLDPEINIRYGTYYLSYLYDIFHEWETVYAAYNAGMGRVKGWLQNKEYSEDGVLLTSIPYSETEKYVKSVSTAVEKYRELLNEGET